MKPTYEQLEQQLAEVISERDAAVKAELVWETSMMEACGEDGPASVATEIAALRAQRDTALESLRQQLAAVVAENGKMLRLLTDISVNHDEYVNTDEYLYAGVPMDYVSEINAYVSRDVDAENPFKATDTYLAEVRASGVDAAIEHLHKKLEGTGRIGVPVMALEWLAKELRHGAVHEHR